MDTYSGDNLSFCIACSWALALTPDRAKAQLQTNTKYSF